MKSLETKFVVLGTQEMVSPSESCYDVREYMDILNDKHFIHETEEQKVLFIGPSGVGKTSVVVRYVSNMFNQHASPTIGASFFTCKMVLDNYNIKLQVWDTAGQERFRSMAPMYYRKANAAMLVFDITNEETFLDMKTWVHELRKNVDTKIVLSVLGNKCDLVNEREVTKDDAMEYARSINASYYETSALSNEGIQDAFCAVARELIDVYEDSPNSGIHVFEGYSSSLASRNNANSLNLRSNQEYSNGEDTRTGRLCC